MRTHQDDGYLQARRRDLTRNPTQLPPLSWTSKLYNYNKTNFVVEVTQSVVYVYDFWQVLNYLVPQLLHL